MEEIPDLVIDLPLDGEITTQKVQATPFVPTSSTPTRLDRKIPITIVTGYLGSGKSTLLKQIGLRSKKRLAIILNEFGDSSVIEKSVTIQDQSESVEEWLDIGNGCLCCTVKDSGVNAIENLIENSKDKIDYILLETTGVADPAPIAKMFWLDEGLASNIYIDGVVTVVDSSNIIKCLDDVGGHWHKENSLEQIEEGVSTAHLQIAMGDVILLNKSDKVDDASEIISRVKAINDTSPILPTSFGDVDTREILDLHAFEAANSRRWTAPSATFHDHRITTVALEFPFFQNPSAFAKVESFLQSVLWENVVNGKPVEIHRLKGLLVCRDDVRVVQGVRETYEIIENGTLLDGVSANKLVFIGKDLSRQDLEIELGKFLLDLSKEM